MGKESLGSIAAMSVWRLAQIINAQNLVSAAYQGVLGRQPDKAGAESYALEVRGPQGLAGVIANLVGSDEFWKRTLINHAPDLADALTDGLFGQCGGHDDLRAVVRKTLEQGEINAGISVLARSSEFWRHILSERAYELVSQIELSMFGGQIDEVWREHAVQALRQGPEGLAEALSQAARIQEHWDGLFAERSGEFVQAAFKALLGRVAESDAIETYSPRLVNLDSLSSVLADIAASDEAWRRLFSARAAEFMSQIERSMFAGQVDESWREYSLQTIQRGPDGLADVLLRSARSLEHWEVLFGEHSQEFVQIAFQAVLGRDAESGALDEYVPRIRDIASLGKVVGEIALSEESWQRHLENHGRQLLDLIYRAVLQRAANTTEIERWEGQDTSIAAIKGLIEELLGSEEFKRKQFIGTERGAGFSAELLDAAYRGMLGRPVDSNGLNEYAKRINTAKDFSSVITSLRQSNEFRKYLGGLEKVPEPVGTWHEVVARIEGLYARYLNRPASAQEIAQYLQEETPLWQIHADLLKKAPLRAGPLRVLLFGAFGNGNMGDAYQAIAVRSHLQQQFGGRPFEVFACSLLSSSDYCYPEEYKLPSQSIMDADFVNSFDYLVIGGGGLLAHPHDPLADIKWCRSILTPMILLAVGATEPEVARHHILLRQALKVIGRDEVSVKALNTVRSDARLAGDPILCLGSVHDLLPAPSVAPDDQSNDSVLWVLKYPSNDEDLALLGKIREYIKDNSHQNHMIVGMEPALDQVLIGLFDETPILLTEDLDQLCQLISRAGQVFSMRYHGAIFALLMDRRVVGASQSKLHELARKLGHSNGYLERSAELSHEMWDKAMSCSQSQLRELNCQFVTMLRELGWA